MHIFEKKAQSYSISVTNWVGGGKGKRTQMFTKNRLHLHGKCHTSFAAALGRSHKTTTSRQSRSRTALPHPRRTFTPSLQSLRHRRASQGRNLQANNLWQVSVNAEIYCQDSSQSPAAVPQQTWSIIFISNSKNLPLPLGSRVIHCRALLGPVPYQAEEGLTLHTPITVSAPNN